MKGPIDYIVVGFEGNSFDGSILHALENAIDSGVIALVSLIFISKDEFGNVTTLDTDQSQDEHVVQFVEKYHASSQFTTSDDIDEVAEGLDNNTSAGLLIVEQLWALPLKKALLQTGGFLLAEGRIHPEAAEELDDEEEE